MKPLRLKIQAFGPYVEMQTVDFEKLSESGIFLIKGPTGGGKTTIFDAMTFALYGGSSGDDSKSKVGRNDLEQWRCNQADRGTATVVSFLFSVRGKKYEFTRKLVPKRVSLSEQYSAGEIDEHGILNPFFENPKKDMLTKKAEELIGLTKEQFRQVVLLPQGQFERFLTASSEEKGAILEKIFDAQRWDAYADRFCKTAAEREAALKSEQAEIQRSLAEEQFATIPELEAHLADLTQKRAENAQAKADFNAEEMQSQLNADIALGVQYHQLLKLRESMTAMEAQAAEIAADRALLDRAGRAESLRQPIADFERAEAELKKRQAAVALQEKKLPKAEKDALDAVQTLESHLAKSPVPQLQQKIGEYASKRTVYETIEGLRCASQKADQALKQAQAEAEKAAKALDKVAGKAKEGYEAFQTREEQSRTLRNRYYAGIYGELAAALEENAPCPVCGSREHPNPARRSQDSVSKEAMEAAEKGAEQARQVWQTMDNKREEAQREKEEGDRSLAACRQTAAAAEAALKSAQSGLVEGIPTLEALERKLQELNEAVQAYEQQTLELRAAAQNAEKKRDDLKTTVQNAAQDALDAQAAWEQAKVTLDAALAELGYPDAGSAKADLRTDAQRGALSEKIHRYDGALEETGKSLEAKQRELSGLEMPDETRFEIRQKEIQEKTSAFAQTEADLKSKIERLSRKKKTLLAKQAHVDENIQQAEDDLEFGKKLRGDAGIGLQRYVLAILFNQVIGEANRMLAKVHEGRYHLYRSDSKGKGNKRGLELKVHDNRSPEAEGRSVAMLSGGEKFLVSLALSIGLSTVAQKGGVQIEALFIDEGFGTLDDSSIHDAMDVLESVRRSCGMIGIISHVQMLESCIPAHLEVVKTGEGSRIRVG